MLLSAILVLLLILISHSPTPPPTSPAPASCTYAISAASDPCLTLKMHPPLPPPSSTQKLDYCNSLFLNLDSTQIQRLQLIQNSVARAVTRTPASSYHSCP